MDDLLNTATDLELSDDELGKVFGGLEAFDTACEQSVLEQPTLVEPVMM